MSAINHDLLSEIIFTNDSTFIDIHIKKARMISYLCKAASKNINIKLSYDRAKAKKYSNKIIQISRKKTTKELDKNDLDEMEGECNLNITDNYKKKIQSIITDLLKENTNIIEYVKDRMFKEHLQNKNRFIKILKKLLGIIKNIGIDLDNPNVGDLDICEADDDYMTEKYNRIRIITISKYNSYFLNLLNNSKNDKEIIDYISSEHFDNNWYRLPVIFT